MTECLKFGSQLGMVIDLTVVRDNEPTLAGRHGLLSSRAEIDDRKSSVTHSKCTIDEDSFSVGPAMGD
jgi:hypothetical protein